MKMFRLLIIVIVICFAKDSFGNKIYDLKSPNEKLSINFWLTENGEPVYSISSLGESIFKQSKLGVVRSDGNFSTDLILDSVSNVVDVKDEYKLLHGKRLECNYSANKKIFYLRNSDSKKIEIIFQVSNDGVAFRYYFPENSDAKLKIYNEATSFNFDTSTKAFLQPCPDARTGWSFSQPSYEEYYQMEIPVGTVSPYQAGWVLPALFNYKNYWVSITETAVDTNYCGTRLSQFSPDGEYSVQFPQPQEVRGNESALPESTLPWFTPWRVIAISENIGGLVASTIGTDLAIPQKYDVSSWLKPGIASWSWVILKDDSTTFDTQKRFIDFASQMNWEYCLIDALWDTQIGYEKIKELADYAKTKNVKILLWYNSAGDWNTTPLTPRDKMSSKEIRRNELQKIHEMGIAGIKVDFFGGDGQSMMKYYIDILKDAADYKIAVNFHGCTLPRGWYRTYPNLVSMESIRGEEYVTFDQSNADQQPSHCAMIPFTRNLFDPMDFTPVNFSGIPNINRKTTKGFEIALSVLFTSGIQHIAETPKGMNAQKDFVQEFMKTLPERWEDVKFIDGYPGKYVVLARKSGNEWYIGCINSESEDRIITLNLPFINKNSKGKIITDSVDSENLIQEEISFLKTNKIVVKPHSGFVLKIN
ncbi:MAG: glycoside hydrolase family 97 catalytic domain-containing protein [Ignavibacteriae bacterium]|nr:glycoside hydrolase family 97 catalytic domain-containing protein [Ignavibacteriota bacterium]